MKWLILWICGLFGILGYMIHADIKLSSQELGVPSVDLKTGKLRILVFVDTKGIARVVSDKDSIELQKHPETGAVFQINGEAGK